MSAFDEAASGFGRASAGPARGAQSPGMGRNPSSRAAAGAAASGDAEFNGTAAKLRDELRHVLGNIEVIKRQVDAIGARTDSTDTRKTLRQNIQATEDALKTIRTQITHMASDPPTLPEAEKSSRRLLRDRITKSYTEAKAALEQVVARAAEAQRRHPNPPGSKTAAAAAAAQSTTSKAAGPGAAESDRLLAQMQAVDLTEALISERDQGIEDIATSVVEVNEAFRDLAQLVERQGESLERIDINVTDAHATTEDGVGQLQKAEKYQKQYRSWLLILVGILICVGGGLTAYFLLRSK